MTEMGSVAGGALLGGAARGPQYTDHGWQAGGALGLGVRYYLARYW